MVRTATPKTGRVASAFTLLELLVAMTVLSVILVILLSMVDGATRLWRESERRVDSYREARAALNLIASDLQSAFSNGNPGFFVWAETDADIAELVNGAASAQFGDALFFVTALSREAQEFDDTNPAKDKAKSDLCAVGYFLAFDTASQSPSAKKSYNLYRYFLSSDPTFQNIKNGAKFPFYSGAPTASSDSIEVELVARNIVEFKVVPRSIVKTAAGDFDRITDFDSSSTVLPDVVDVTLVAVNEDTASIWKGDATAWQDKASDIFVRNARSFTSRVILPAASSSVNQLPTPTPTPVP